MIAHALIVGVADYASVPRLPAAVGHDVADIAALLVDPNGPGVPHDMITLLVDRDAKAAAIRAAFVDLAARVPEDGTFLFYFSGHGERAVFADKEQSWLLPHDADLTRLEATALASTEIVALLDAIRAKRQVLMIDACHAGGIGSSKGAENASPKGFGAYGMDALARGAGRALLTSSRADETSAILPGARNSVFTTALIEALGGATIDRGDGLIGVLDVFDYVSAEVPKRIDQHPIFHAGDLDSNFALARRPATTPSSAPTIGDLTTLFTRLYPAGPLQDDLWSRAGGDVSRLVLTGIGAAQWHSALNKVRLGGGGLQLDDLLHAAAADYPNHPELTAFLT